MWKCKCGETNPDTSNFCQSCGDSKSTSEFSDERLRKQQMLARENEEKRRIEIERERRARAQQEYNYKIDNLSQMGLDGYYEYKVVDLSDSDSGGIYTGKIENTY